MGSAKQLRIERYGRAYDGDRGFERVMVTVRQQAVMETLAKTRPEVVLEVGCGLDLLFDRVSSEMEPAAWLGRWVIVEPNRRFAEAARERHPSSPIVQIVEAFVEDSGSLRDISPDLVVCSGMLHEVTNPDEVLAALADLMAPGSLIHVNVPNALSLHRRLAVAMGLIDDPHLLTERNLHLDQHRVYDAASLQSAVTAAGFEVEESGGHFLKPFTHAQMEEIDFVDERMIEGLYELGRELPEIAAEIYVNARKPVS